MQPFPTSRITWRCQHPACGAASFDDARDLTAHIQATHAGQTTPEPKQRKPRQPRQQKPKAERRGYIRAIPRPPSHHEVEELYNLLRVTHPRHLTLAEAAKLLNLDAYDLNRVRARLSGRHVAQLDKRHAYLYATHDIAQAIASDRAARRPPPADLEICHCGRMWIDTPSLMAHIERDHAAPAAVAA